MKVKVRSSEQMKKLEVGQLGLVNWHSFIYLTVFLGFNDSSMKGYFYLLGTVVGVVKEKDIVDVDKSYLDYFMPKIVEYNMLAKLDKKYMFSSDVQVVFETYDLPKIDMTKWYLKNRLIDNSLPELSTSLSIWDAQYVKPKDLVVRRIYARKSSKNYYLYVYMGEHIMRGEERYVLVKYDDAATYADYMTYIKAHTSNVIYFKQAPTNCVELDDISNANITATQTIINKCRRNRMIE